MGQQRQLVIFKSILYKRTYKYNFQVLFNLQLNIVFMLGLRTYIKNVQKNSNFSPFNSLNHNKPDWNKKKYALLAGERQQTFTQNNENSILKSENQLENLENNNMIPIKKNNTIPLDHEIF